MVVFWFALLLLWCPSRYDHCCFGMSGALLPRAVRDGWMFASHGLEVGRFVVEAALSCRGHAATLAGGRAAVQAISHLLNTARTLTTLDDFAPPVGLLMALCVDLSSRVCRPEEEEREEHQHKRERDSTMEGNEDAVSMSLAALMQPFVELADVAWAPRWFEDLPSLLSRFEENYFWAQRRVHPTDATSLPPPPTGFWIAPTSRPSQLLAVLAAHALHHCARVGLSPTITDRPAALMSERGLFSAVLSPLKMGAQVGALWGDLSAQMAQFEAFCTMCAATVESVTRLSRCRCNDCTPRDQSSANSQRWVVEATSCADDDDPEAEAEASSNAAFLRRVLDLRCQASSYGFEFWREARGSLCLAEPTLVAAMLSTVQDDVISAADWDLDRMHQCICGLKWMVGSPDASLASILGAQVATTVGSQAVNGTEANTGELLGALVQLFIKVVLKAGKDGYTSAWVARCIAAVATSLVERIRSTELSFPALPHTQQMFIEALVVACVDLLAEGSSSERSLSSRVLLMVPASMALCSILWATDSRLPAGCAEFLLQTVRDCRNMPMDICHAEAIQLLGVAIRQAAMVDSTAEDSAQVLEQCAEALCAMMTRARHTDRAVITSLAVACSACTASPVCIAVFQDVRYDEMGILAHNLVHVLGAALDCSSVDGSTAVGPQLVRLFLDQQLELGRDLLSDMDSTATLREQLQPHEQGSPLDTTEQPQYHQSPPIGSAQVLDALVLAGADEAVYSLRAIVGDASSSSTCTTPWFLQVLVRCLSRSLASARRDNQETRDWWSGARRTRMQTELHVLTTLRHVLQLPAGQHIIATTLDDAVLHALLGLLSECMLMVAPALQLVAQVAARLLAVLAAQPRVAALLQDRVADVRQARSILVAHARALSDAQAHSVSGYAPPLPSPSLSLPIVITEAEEQLSFFPWPQERLLWLAVIKSQVSFLPGEAVGCPLSILPRDLLRRVLRHLCPLQTQVCCTAVD